MSADNLTPGLAGAGPAGLLAAAHFALHVQLTAAAGDAPSPAAGLALAEVATGHLRRAQRLAAAAPGEAGGNDERIARVVRHLVGAPAPGDWLEGCAGAAISAAVLAEMPLAAARPGPGGVLAASAGDLDGLVVQTVARAVAAEPVRAGLLSMYGRRVFGQVLVAGQLLDEEPLPGFSPGQREILRGAFGEAGAGFAELMSAMGLRG